MFFRGGVLFDRHRILVKWLISYISVLLVPLLISCFVYMEAEGILQKEINRANSVLLKQVQEITDNHLRELERLSQNISWNSRVQELMYLKSPLKDSDYYKIFKTMQEFRLFSTSNGFIDDLYVYYKSSDIVVSTKYNLPSADFYATVHKSQKLSYAQWLQIINNKYTKDFINIDRVGEDGKVHKSIAFIRSLPIENPLQADATLVILADESKYLQAIKNIQLVNEGNVLLLNSRNDILTSTMPVTDSTLPEYGELEKDSSKVLFKKVGSENMAVSFAKSDVADWKFVSLIPAGIFWEKAVYIKRVILICVILSIFLGGAATYFSLKKNYNPINNLIESIVKRAGLKFNKGYNEYDFISEAISSTLGEKDKMNRKLKQQNVMMRSNFFAKMLKGEQASDIPLEEALSSFDIVFVSENFAVMLFYITDFGDLFSAEKDTSFDENLKLVQLIITNVVEELVGNKNLCYMIEMDGMLTCIVNFNEAESDGMQEMTKITKEALQFIKDNFHIGFKVTISNMHKTVYDLPKAYQEAINTMEYKIIMGSEGDILSPADLKESEPNYYYPLQLEQQFINCIKAGDFSRALEIFEGIFRRNFVEASPSIQLAKCLMFDLVSTLLKTLDEISSTKEENFIEGLNYFDRLLNCKTVKEMKVQMTDILQSVCSYIVETKKKNDGNELSSKVIDYIKNNYWNANLNITMVGEVFGMTPAYLSKIFKEQTGEALLDFINNIRLIKAKQLLKEDKLSINEAAELSGYNDVNTFIRIFKKYEGITPGRYKENNII